MSDDHGIGGEVSKLIEKMRSTDQEGGVEVFEMLDMRVRYAQQQLYYAAIALCVIPSFQRSLGH